MVLALAGCGAEEAPAPIADASVVIKSLARGLREGRPEVVWNLLPPSYCKDIESLVYEFAMQVDPVTYDRFFAAVGKLGAALRAKKKWVLASPAVARVCDPEQLAAQWGAVVGFFDQVAISELSTTSGLQSLDIARFLRGNGRGLWGGVVALGRVQGNDPTGWCRGISAVPVAVRGNVATVRVAWTGGPSTEVKLTQVEERWVPIGLATTWSGIVTALKSAFASMPMGRSHSAKLQMRVAVQAFERAVDRMAQAATPAELELGIEDLLAPLVAEQAEIAAPGK